MTDNAERKVREWARGRNGDPLTNKDIVDLVLAVDADGDARHTETIGRLDDVDERHITLCLRVSALEEASQSCQERVKAYVSSEHDERHGKHMAEHHGPERRASDPPDSAFLEKRQSAYPDSVRDERSFREMMLAWTATKKVLAVIASALILITVGITVSYVGHRLAEEQPVPQPAVTVTASPSP